MDTKNEKNVEIFDKLSGSMITIKQSDAKKLTFLNYRFFFLIGLTIVSITLFDINIYLIVGAFLILSIILQLAYKKFYNSLHIINKKIVKKNTLASSTTKYMLIRSIVYFVLGAAIISTVFIQYGSKIGVNESFLLIIGLLSLYTSFSSIKKFLNYRRDWMKKSKFVTGKRGMVGAANGLIASTGLEVLLNEGNAMDAAIAMALTSNVVLPDMCGIGGDTFFLYFDAKTKKVHALNGSGYVGENYNEEFFKKKGLTSIPEQGIHSISVPGAISAYFKGLEKFGTKSFKELSKNAIYYAENGFELSERTRNYVIKKSGFIEQSDELYNMFYKNETIKSVSDLIFNKQLAKTLRILNEKGSNGFYNHLAKEFVPRLNSLGAEFTIEDFSNYESEWVSPISTTYKDHIIYELPPLSQGIIHLQAHNILENVDLKEYGLNSADAIHTMVEAKKLAFSDRINLFGDPKFNKNPIERVLSKEYGKKQFEKISLSKTIKVEEDLFNHKATDTTSFVVVDKDGNACSFITSVADVFGSFVMDKETGIIFNNRLGMNFNLDKNNPNYIEPRKTSMNTLVTYIVTDRNNNCKFLGNTPGGDRQPQWNLQTIVNILDYKIDALEVFKQPYWYDQQSGNPFNKTVENILYIEDSIDDDVVTDLIRRGHKVEVIKKCNCINQLIEINDNGVYCGLEDWRSDGVTIGY